MQQFIFLDGDFEREQLTEQVKGVRRAVLDRAALVPPEEHFTPRYGVRSLAGTLAHLQTADACALWLVKAASNGYAVRLPRAMVKSVDQLLARLFQKRLVDVTVKGIRQQQGEICEFIRSVPMDKLSRDVLHPGRKDPYTVEQALQVYFVHYWQQHLNIMEAADSVTGKP